MTSRTVQQLEATCPSLLSLQRGGFRDPPRELPPFLACFVLVGDLGRSHCDDWLELLETHHTFTLDSREFPLLGTQSSMLPLFLPPLS